MTPKQWIDLPPLWLALFVMLTWGQGRFLPVGPELPGWFTRGAAIVLVGAGITLTARAVLGFRRHRTTFVPHHVPSRIITSGIFAHSRNPIYLSDVLFLAAAVLWWQAWLSAVLLPLFVAILTRRFIAPEEAWLKQYFETDFSIYAEKTPRWF